MTDGLRWEHFSNLKPGDLAPSEILNLELDDLGQVAAYLVQELDAALVSPDEEQLDVLADEVEQIQEEITKLRALEKRVQELEKTQVDKTSVLSTSEPHIPYDPSWHPLTGLSGLKGTKPSNFRLPNGQEIPVKRWGHVLFEACRYALTTNPDLPVPLLDRAGKKTALIQQSPFPRNINSKEVEVNGHVFYVYVNYDAFNCAVNAAHVLKQVSDEFKQTEAAVAFA